VEEEADEIRKTEGRKCEVRVKIKGKKTDGLSLERTDNNNC